LTRWPLAEPRPVGGVERDREECVDDLVALQLLAPILEERAGLTEQVDRALLLFGDRDLDGVSGPIDPGAIAVVVDRLLVADEGTGGDRLTLEAGNQRDVDLLAALLQVVDDPDDGGELGADVGREQVLANVLAGDFLAEDDQFVI
jgi:hypothetical protein